MAYACSFKELTVWQRAMELVDAVYTLSRQLPKEELYGMTSQIRRCAVSIPSNIAEGYKRRSIGDYVRFLSIADGSAAELETQLEIIRRQYRSIDVVKVSSTLEEVQKMLTVMIRKTNTKR